MLDLALFTAEELANELVRRSTFVGAIIWSQDDHRRDGQTHKKFRVVTNLADEDQLAGLLGRLTSCLEQNQMNSSFTEEEDI